MINQAEIEAYQAEVSRLLNGEYPLHSAVLRKWANDWKANRPSRSKLTSLNADCQTYITDKLMEYVDCYKQVS